MITQLFRIHSLAFANSIYGMGGRVGCGGRGVFSLPETNPLSGTAGYLFQVL